MSRGCRKAYHKHTIALSVLSLYRIVHSSRDNPVPFCAGSGLCFYLFIARFTSTISCWNSIGMNCFQLSSFKVCCAEEAILAQGAPRMLRAIELLRCVFAVRVAVRTLLVQSLLGAMFGGGEADAFVQISTS